MKNAILMLMLFMLSCKATKKTIIPSWERYDESEEIAVNAKHESQKMQFKLIQSKVLDKNIMLQTAAGQLNGFTEADYQRLMPFILEQNIPGIQSHIQSGELSYEKLTQWYLYRIVKFESNRNRYLNSVIAINPTAVKEARKKDRNKSATDHLIYGMPILLKDNIDMEGMPTTAGSVALINNKTSNAFIAQRIMSKGGIILGKANLSEWANYICDCPNGYSAVGGQTLNPYGRKIFDTGGSSSGSGSSMAANYAAAAVGTETSGSILSPSSANSIVGLKPTVGLLSRTGIVPISGTLDTPGPMTRNITDNAILLSAMSGEDSNDESTKNNPKNKNYVEDLKTASLKGLRFGVYKNYLTDSLYKLSIEKIISLGAVVIELEPEKVNLDGFGTLLNADMKVDLPAYINKYASKEISLHSVADISDFNKQDSLIRIPYGQVRFEGILNDSTSPEGLNQLVTRLQTEGKAFFEKPMAAHQLDAILSINNRNAGFAAAAKYPCLTVPMGYTKTGEPAGITFIARPFEEDKLLKMGYAYEQATMKRKMPVAF